MKAGLTLVWSQGPVEGHVHRLKLLKRQAYGRANFETLRKRVARLMRQQGWYARQHYKRGQTTQQHPDHEKAAAVLNRDFEVSASNRKWGTDVSALWTQEGWLYVAGVLDLYARALGGWAMAPMQDEELVQLSMRWP